MAGNQWFRLYAEFATDPKVQMMSEAYQRRFVMLLCLRCSNDHVTLQDDEVAFQLRISNDEWADTKAALIAKNLITDDNNPTAWDKRQFVSDSSAERVKRHRENKKRACNVTETPPEAEAEAEAESDTEADTEKPRGIARAISDSTVVSPGDDNQPAQSPVARVCLGLKAMGYGDTNPHDPKLAALLDAGMTPEELLSAGEYGRGKSKGFRWVLATAEGRRRDAENVKPLPAKAAAGSLSKAGQKTAEAAARWLESQGVQP